MSTTTICSDHTFTRHDLDRGFEPDSCFYAQNAERVRNKTRLDMTTDPPPDLLVEIDITHSSINKLALYWAFGVPEIWRYNGSRLEILRLGENGYESAQASGTLPGVPATELTQLLEEGKSHLLGGWSKLVRSWAHQRFGKG